MIKKIDIDKNLVLAKKCEKSAERTDLTKDLKNTKLTQAIGYLDEILNSDKKNYKVIIAKARILRKLKKSLRGLALLNSFYEDNLENIDFLIELGTIELDLKDYTKARNTFEKVLELDNRSFEANFLLGETIFQEESDIFQAKYYFNTAIEIDNSDLRPRYYLGLIYERNNELNNAVKEYEQIIKLDPNNTNVLSKLVRIYEKLGNKKNSHSSLKKAVDIINESRMKIEDSPFIKDESQYKRICLLMQKIEPMLEASESIDSKEYEKLINWYNELASSQSEIEERVINTQIEFLVPLNKTVGRIKKSLLTFSMLAIIVFYTKLIPKGLPQFDLTFTLKQQKGMLIIFGIIILYYSVQLIFLSLRNSKIKKIKRNLFDQNYNETKIQDTISALNNTMSKMNIVELLFNIYFPILLSLISIVCILIYYCNL